MVNVSIDLKRTALTSAGAALLPYVQLPMHASALKAEFQKWHMYVKAPARLMLYAGEVGACCTSTKALCVLLFVILKLFNTFRIAAVLTFCWVNILEMITFKKYHRQT